MSHTFKNSPPKKRFLEVVRRENGTYDLFLDGHPERSSIPEQWLYEELCVGFGFCGEEYKSILCEVNQSGRAKLRLSA
jgi:hypothetical protein